MSWAGSGREVQPCGWWADFGWWKGDFVLVDARGKICLVGRDINGISKLTSLGTARAGEYGTERMSAVTMSGCRSSVIRDQLELEDGKQFLNENIRLYDHGRINCLNCSLAAGG